MYLCFQYAQSLHTIVGTRGESCGTVGEGSRHVPCSQVWHPLQHHEIPVVQDRAGGRMGQGKVMGEIMAVLVEIKCNEVLTQS